MKLKTMMASAMLMVVSATAAMAFPSWMGVYGSIERHTDGNPGTYTVLMNQDYWGLNAEIGVQVQHVSLGGISGQWNVYPLTYIGNQEGNSVWSFTPSQVLPEGTRVQFYFHGWDNQGGNLWDNNGGANYSFLAESMPQFDGDWGSELSIPHVAGAYAFDMAGADGSLFAVWQEGGYWAEGGFVPSTVMFSSKTAGHSWELPQPVAAGSYPLIAASSEGVFILYTAAGYPQTASLVRSTDLGHSWSAPVNDSFMTRYARLRAAGNSIYVVYDEFAAPETSEVFFRRMAVDASVWEPAQSIFNKSSYKATVYVKDFDVHGDQVSLSTYLQGWYGGFATTYYHESANGGQSWQEQSHGLDQVQIASDASGKRYVLGYDSTPVGGGMYVASKTAGSVWSTPALFQEGVVTASGLQVIGGSLVAVLGNYENPMECFVSEDGGFSWSDPAPVGILGGTASGNISDGADMHLFYYSGESLSTGEQGLGDPMQWAGNVSTWPEDGEIDGGDILWVNAETWLAGTASELYIVYSSDGVTWEMKSLSRNTLVGNNDAWHVDLGGFLPGDEIQYAIQIIDNRGTVTWLNNGGQNYHATVNPAIR